MKIALIGESGMLAAKVKEVFRKAGHELIAPTLEQLDLMHPKALEAFYKTGKFEGTVNCSGFTNVDACEDPVQYPMAFRINGPAVGEMAKLSKDSNRWMIHISTDYVFDGKGTNPWKETDIPKPINAYGRTKWEGEWKFQEAGNPGWIVRTSWLYGPNGKNFVKTMAGLLRQKERVEVVDDQVGGPTCTEDLAIFLLDLAETKPPAGLYHFANEGYVSWHGLSIAIRDEMGIKSCQVLPVTSDRFPRPARRPANSRFDLSKARSVSRHPLVPWREALKRYLAEENYFKSS